MSVRNGTSAEAVGALAVTAAAGDFRAFIRSAAVSPILAALSACLAVASAASCFVAFFMLFFAIVFSFACPYPNTGAWNSTNQHTGVKNRVAILAFLLSLSRSGSNSRLASTLSSSGTTALRMDVVSAQFLSFVGPLANSMLVPVMNLRVVRVDVNLWLVPVGMRVRLAWRVAGSVWMLMMVVVRVEMVVLHLFVAV